MENAFAYSKLKDDKSGHHTTLDVKDNALELEVSTLFLYNDPPDRIR